MLTDYGLKLLFKNMRKMCLILHFALWRDISVWNCIFGQSLIGLWTMGIPKQASQCRCWPTVICGGLDVHFLQYHCPFWVLKTLPKQANGVLTEYSARFYFIEVVLKNYWWKVCIGTGILWVLSKKISEVGSLYYFACGSGQSDMNLVGLGKTTLRVYRMLGQCSVPHLLLSFIHLY